MSAKSDQIDAALHDLSLAMEALETDAERIERTKEVPPRLITHIRNASDASEKLRDALR